MHPAAGPCRLAPDERTHHEARNGRRRGLAALLERAPGVHPRGGSRPRLGDLFPGVRPSGNGCVPGVALALWRLLWRGPGLRQRTPRRPGERGLPRHGSRRDGRLADRPEPRGHPGVQPPRAGHPAGDTRSRFPSLRRTGRGHAPGHPAAGAFGPGRVPRGHGGGQPRGSPCRDRHGEPRRSGRDAVPAGFHPRPRRTGCRAASAGGRRPAPRRKGAAGTPLRDPLATMVEPGGAVPLHDRTPLAAGWTGRGSAVVGFRPAHRAVRSPAGLPPERPPGGFARGEPPRKPAGIRLRAAARPGGSRCVPDQADGAQFRPPFPLSPIAGIPGCLRPPGNPGPCGTLLLETGARRPLAGCGRDPARADDPPRPAPSVHHPLGPGKRGTPPEGLPALEGAGPGAGPHAPDDLRGKPCLSGATEKKPLA